jgi:hypothetical protein
MPTSMTVVATRTSAAPEAKRSIASAFSRGFIWPCSSTTSKSRTRSVRSRSYSAVAARAASASDSATSGQTTNAWRPCASSSRMRSYARSRSRSPPGHVGLDRLAALGQLAQDGDVERAERRQAQRARDRRGGHVQHVRHQPGRRLGVERGALAHAEAVLLVDHHDREAVEDDGSSMSACVPTTSDSAPARACRARRRGARRSSSRSAAPGAPGRRHERLDGREVLLGQRLGRRHQRRLHPVLDRAEHGVQRDDGLARADLPHEQALHRAAAGRSASISSIARCWSPVGANGSCSASQRSVSDGASVSAAASRPARRSSRRRSWTIWSSSSSSKASRARPGLAVAEVRGGDRAGLVGKALGDRAGARAAGRQVGDRVAVLLDERGDPRRVQALRRRIGRDAADRRPVTMSGRGVVADLEAVAGLVLAREHQPRADGGTGARATAG